MDNATHSLAGVFLAQCALGRQSEPERARLWLPFHLAGVLGSNLPDLDFVYTSLTEGKLGYLLHHRGHTHTAPIAVLLGVGLAGVLAWSLRRRGVPLRSRTAAWLYGLAGVATLLHIAMDFGNGYGVHPWWPFDNRWFYGDAIFIVEPWLLSALAVPACFSVRSRVTRVCLAGLVALVCGATWLLPLPTTSGVLLLLWTGLLALPWLATRGQPRVWRGLTLWRALAGVFAFYGLAFGSRIAAVERFTRTTADAYRIAGERVTDVIATPAPATTWCWDLIVVSHSSTTMHLRTARVSLAPWLTTPTDCPRLRDAPTAPLVATNFAANVDPGVLVERDHLLSRGTLQSIAGNCWAQAYLRFARAPYWEPHAGILGDLRYDRTPGEDFADYPLPNREDCPRFVPPWVPPRQDVLDGLLGDAVAPEASR